MAPAVCRAGILAALRSVKLAGAAVGIVITASHNPIGDNGVKIADPDGGMMAQHWEPFADALANAPDPDALLQVMDQAVRPRLFLSFVPLVSIRIQRQLHRLIHTNKYWYLLGVNKTKIRESCKPPFVLPTQMVLQFAKDEGIPLGGEDTAQVLLGRDTRPTGAYLLDAALQVCHVDPFLQN